MANSESDEMKEKRLQVRMKADLKKWFSRYAESHGGMSRVVTEYIRRLQKKDPKDGQPDSK